MHCLTCGRRMVVARGNICMSCHEKIERGRLAKKTDEMIADTLGEFSMFENGPKPAKFVRREIPKKRFRFGDGRNKVSD